MSEMAKKARSEMRAKAVRLAGGGVGSNDPYKPVDASSWAPPPDALDAGRKTGARPIRPRIYKHGGKIQGDRAPRHPGKACRGGGFAEGGKVPKVSADSKYFGITKDGRSKPITKEQHEQFQASKPTWPRKPRASGGRTGTGPLSMINTADENKNAYGSFHEGGYKRGGMPKMGNMADIKKGHVDPAKHEKGGTYFGGTRPTGGRMPRAHGGRAKGKTNINIVIAQPKAGGGPMGAQQMPPQGVVRPPMPPPQMQPPAGGPPPMPPPGMGGPPGGMPPGAGPMMRKSGGRTTGDAIPLKDYGSNSGLGRLEKIKIQARSHRATGGSSPKA
jgi:hypothetical protein